MYCVKCGKEVHNEAVICPYCGCATGNPFPNEQNRSGGVNPSDAPSAGYAVLGFFIPIVGLILYLIWRQEYPLRAKSAGKGALISVIVEVALAVVLIIFYFFVLVLVFSSAPEFALFLTVA